MSDLPDLLFTHIASVANKLCNGVARMTESPRHCMGMHLCWGCGTAKCLHEARKNLWF